MRTFASIKPLLEPWGELKSQPASEWCGEILLPPVVNDFYHHIGPWGQVIHDSVGPVGLAICAGGNPVNVPILKRLWERQSCYRWHGNTGERLPDWDDAWLVIATEGSNPFILDMVNGSVYFDLAGGKPTPKLFAPDLVTAFGAIATVANTMRVMGETAFDETYELTSAAREHIVHSLDRFLDGSFDVKEMLTAWRWYT